MNKDNNKKGLKKKKQGEGGEESDVQESFDLEVIKTLH